MSVQMSVLMMVTGKPVSTAQHHREVLAVHHHGDSLGVSVTVIWTVLPASIIVPVMRLMLYQLRWRLPREILVYIYLSPH